MNTNMGEIWTRWYTRDGVPEGRESRSGKTSSLKATANLRRELPRVLERFSVRTLFDAPCGDMNWMRHFLRHSDVSYLGGDVVKSLIEELIHDPYLKARGEFVVIDLTTDPLPSADMMLARDFLFHLSYRDTLSFLKNFAEFDIPYLLTTSYINEGKFENWDTKTPKPRLIDLFQPPYSFPQDTLRFHFGWQQGSLHVSLGALSSRPSLRKT